MARFNLYKNKSVLGIVACPVFVCHAGFDLRLMSVRFSSTKPSITFCTGSVIVMHAG